MASTVAVALYKTLRMERGSWLIVTVLVVVKPVFADTRKRAAERVVGSVVGGFVAALWLFAYRLVPETKGRTLEEIEAFWRART